MADSIRELILQSLEIQMQAITTGNGYDIDVQNVERARRVFTVGELPAIAIFDNAEDSVSNFNFNQIKMEIAVELHGDAGAVNRSIYGNTLLASLKRAGLSGDVEHGGNASGTRITASSVNYPPDDDVTTVTVLVTFSIDYEEIIGDPFTKP